MRMSTLATWTAAAALCLAGCSERPGGAAGIRIEDAWVRAVATVEQGSMNTAAYMRIVTGSGSNDRLLGVRSDIARMTELHRTTIDRSGLATMAPAGEVELLAGETLTLEPGGLHVMLMGVERSLTEGETVSLTLLFESAGETTFEAEVRGF